MAVNAAASAAAARARKAVEAAANKAKATADAKVQGEAPRRKSAPAAVAPSTPKASAPVAPAASKDSLKTSEDDEQLKALRAEVDHLESSVKSDDSEAPSASMLHVTKKTTKVATPVKSEEGSDSLKSLQDVGGMLSEAMAAGDD